ncbi:MAG: pyridoxamine 5'-phosphate oxidase family protein [Oscillospiraceae bacterium]|nr:pyridoxamine 5'-phosphate oxidase family protein [Oscillospiraceae bacterium]
MQRIYDFLKAAGVYYLATTDGDQPRVRPFGTVDLFNGRLGIQTGRKKDLFRQIEANPRVELCAMHEGKWIRVSGELYADDSVEAAEHMLSDYPSLRSMYAPGDGNCVVLYFKSGRASICSFTEPPVEIEF